MSERRNSRARKQGEINYRESTGSVQEHKDDDSDDSEKDEDDSSDSEAPEQKAAREAARAQRKVESAQRKLARRTEKAERYARKAEAGNEAEASTNSGVQVRVPRQHGSSGQPTTENSAPKLKSTANSSSRRYSDDTEFFTNLQRYTKDITVNVQRQAANMAGTRDVRTPSVFFHTVDDIPKLRDASNYTEWKRTLRMALTTEGRTIIDHTYGPEPSHETEPDPDRLRQKLKYYRNQMDELQSFLFSRIERNSTADSYFNEDASPYENWKKLEEQLTPKGTTRIWTLYKAWGELRAKEGESVDMIAGRIIDADKQLKAVARHHGRTKADLNAKLMLLCNQINLQQATAQIVAANTNLLENEDTCMAFDDLRKLYVEAEAQLATSRPEPSFPFAHHATMPTRRPRRTPIPNFDPVEIVNAGMHALMTDTRGRDGREEEYR
ncbi:hypothetical protein ABVK25_012373 [Lepraria finkii]|uniref:Gag protein n=1 Tax=Lepraria finkii TaxID=1340010 RepID=A0ABR4AFJ7_9LECA